MKINKELDQIHNNAKAPLNQKPRNSNQEISLNPLLRKQASISVPFRKQDSLKDAAMGITSNNESDTQNQIHVGHFSLQQSPGKKSMIISNQDKILKLVNSGGNNNLDQNDIIHEESFESSQYSKSGKSKSRFGISPDPIQSYKLLNL